jgi:threonine dehydratase
VSVDVNDINAAARRLAGKAVETPLLESPLVNDRLGCRLLIKAECLQRTGSFKFRGAYNRICQFTPEERERGVVAYSSGNHAQGVAAAARQVGTKAVIVVPRDIPEIKRRNTESWGAELAFYDRDTEDRVAVARAIADKSGAVIVPPFDDERVIAGQGTIGLEILAQAKAQGTVPDAVLIPCGGGGLTAGIATAIKSAAADCRVFTVEPAGFDDTRRSFAAGERVFNDLGPGHPTTFCDALTAEAPGKLTFPINSELVDGALVLDDTPICQGVYIAFADFKLVLEPSGAIGLAALLSGALSPAFKPAGKTIAVVASGGNVDPATFTEALGRAEADTRAD